MRLLLDTHTYLWAVSDNPLLSHRARDHIQDGENELFLSVASLWEIAIKLSIGKLRLKVSFLELAVDIPTERGVGVLHLTPEHMDIVSRLLFHHRDPFDRLIVAQCQVEGFALVGRDEAFDRYGIERIW